MNETDVIYTPIDGPEQPKIDVPKFKQWLKDNYEETVPFKNALTGNDQTAEVTVDNYPWDLTVVYYKVDYGGTVRGPGWTCKFAEDWPELAEWIPKVYGLELDDLGVIMFLPMRDEHEGEGFWHNDPEPHGLRFYIDFEEPNTNKLFMRRTKTRNPVKPHYGYPFNKENYLQPELLECKIASPQQAFFLNNNNSAHATYTVKTGLTRIACIVACKPSTKKKVTDIVVPIINRSAEKYKDFSLYWKDETQE